ncbi:hypothetical protein [Pseudooceanicola nanhaiensis]|jgi:TRAP-type C4-dicarboxylate transport system substrate-binding protein|uniref:hypothetical protein n=1 Tax=Pseudooceanicola nanhaiensis TaxID=375761 RepID=UPI00300A80AE
MRQLRHAGFALLLAAGGAPAATDEYIYASSLPETHSTYSLGLLPFFERVRTATDGRVDIKYFGTESVGKASTLLSLVEKQGADVAQIVDIYMPAALPVSALLSDAFVMGEDARIMATAVNAMRLLDCPECTEEFAVHNVINFGTYVSTQRNLLMLQGRT